VILAGAAHSAAGVTHAAARPPSGAVAQIVAYARAQLGEPYVWGGTGPGAAGYDCSGLVMQAYAAAGIAIPRTSQEQWAAGPQVSQPARGDLVFFAGADGAWSAPGHVGLVVDPARQLMIDAYETGTPVRYDTYGLPGSAGGLADPVGFTDPAAHGGSS
jgi:cell wall-associated NlpC family hydrolase